MRIHGWTDDLYLAGTDGGIEPGLAGPVSTFRYCAWCSKFLGDYLRGNYCNRRCRGAHRLKKYPPPQDQEESR